MVKRKKIRRKTTCGDEKQYITKRSKKKGKEELRNERWR